MALSLKNKIILVTGASSGIGRAVAQQFAALGAKLILTARRLERLNELAHTLKKELGTECLALQLDVQNKEKVASVLKDLPANWQDIAVLVNNAGLALDSTSLQNGVIDHWETMIDTNIKGLLYVTRTLLPGMIERGQGHVINIGSIAGQDHYPGGNVYSATKHAVRAITKSMQIDLLSTNLRVSEIAPGAVHTEFSEVRWKDKSKSDEFYSQFTALTADDIADAVVYCATRPQHVNVAEMLVLPTVQASCNHFYKEGAKN